MSRSGLGTAQHSKKSNLSNINYHSSLSLHQKSPLDSLQQTSDSLEASVMSMYPVEAHYASHMDSLRIALERSRDEDEIEDQSENHDMQNPEEDSSPERSLSHSFQIDLGRGSRIEKQPGQASKPKYDNGHSGNASSAFAKRQPSQKKNSSNRAAQKYKKD